jgi:hypothetical protein
VPFNMIYEMRIDQLMSFNGVVLIVVPESDFLTLVYHPKIENSRTQSKLC